MVVAAGGMKLPGLLRRSGAEIDRWYRRYADEVFRYALLVLRSRPDAEDVVQIVFVRALRAVERGERVAKPRNWLIKIAHNECRRLLAARRVHAQLPDEIAVEPVERGRADELRCALEALPAHQRRALVLRELEGRTYAEIAASLGSSVSAVETLLFRARRALREQLEAALECDEFALMVDAPGADRARLRAHARVCDSCAHLERQARGRKSRLGRIASWLLPWWGSGAKIAAVAVGTAAVAGAVGGGIAVADRPHHHAVIPNLVPGTGTRFTSSTRPPAVSATVRASRTASLPAAPALHRRHASEPEPTIPPGDEPLPVPEPTEPDPPPVPAPPTHEAAPPASPAAAPVTTVTNAVTTTTSSPVTTPQATVSTPLATATTPTATVPPPTVSAPAVTVPAVTVPAVTVPSVTALPPTTTLPAPAVVNVSGP
jgi:RNA polymerase sigma factor (sigma-70 family)